MNRSAPDSSPSATVSSPRTPPPRFPPTHRSTHCSPARHDVVTAHLDHIGIGPALNRDAIDIDNGALGTAALLAAAEQLAAGPRRQRPVLFAALTAEEKGLLGASHLARHPPAASTATPPISTSTCL
ncbi:MAG: M28 family peptidase [Undibacterium sp.]|nr:M28 family peptidase [Opitutaceae bacterium]